MQPGAYADRDAVIVADAPVDVRARFIARTYGHLVGAILAFTAIEIVLFKTEVAWSMAASMSEMWWAVLGGFILVSWLATHVAHKATSLSGQYLALGVYVVAEALIFVPLLAMAELTAPGVIESAALTTLLGFGALTAVAFWTRKDFSFLGGILKFAGLMALVAIVAALVFDFVLGTFFSVAMIALAGGAILYDTSKILREYPEDRYVGAALNLFASVALMFWYVLRLFMSRD